MGIFTRKGPHSDETYLAPKGRREITTAQAEHRDAVFHGACLGCLNQKGNNQGESMRYCIGCAFFDFNETKPNRRIAWYKGAIEEDY